MREVYRIREIGPDAIDKLVALKGIVIRCSDVIPEMKEAAFLCFKCGRERLNILSVGVSKSQPTARPAATETLSLSNITNASFLTSSTLKSRRLLKVSPKEKLPRPSTCALMKI